MAEAFARNGENRFPRLDAFAGSLRGELAELPALEVFLAFKSFLVRIAEAQLTRLYAQMDPMGARLHRNLRDALRQSPSLAVSKHSHRLIVRLRDVNTCEHLPPFPANELETAIAAAVSAPYSAPTVLDAFQRVMLNQHSFRRSAPLTDLVQAAKRLFEHDLAAHSNGHGLPDIEGLTPFEIEQIESHAKLVVNEKILLTYFARGKVNHRQAEALSAVLEEIIADWCNGTGHQPSLGGYLRRTSTHRREYVRTRVPHEDGIPRTDCTRRTCSSADARTVPPSPGKQTFR